MKGPSTVAGMQLGPTPPIPSNPIQSAPRSLSRSFLRIAVVTSTEETSFPLSLLGKAVFKTENEIDLIEDNCFESLKNLGELNLSWNKIPKICYFPT